jgi:hypothetical protein
VGGVVDGEERCFLAGAKTANQEAHPAGEQFALRPGGGAEEVMVDIDAVFALRVGERIHSGDGVSGWAEYPSRDEADAGDEGGLGENRFEYAHESKDLGKFRRGDLLLQGVGSTPSKRIVMPFFNLFRMIPTAKFPKVHNDNPSLIT